MKASQRTGLESGDFIRFSAPVVTTYYLSLVSGFMIYYLLLTAIYLYKVNK